MAIKSPSGVTQGYTTVSGVAQASSITVAQNDIVLGGPAVPAGADDGLLTELSEQLITEAGDFLIWEEASLTNTYSVDFDGNNDYISIADAPELTFGDASTDDPCSFSVWFKLNAASSNPQRLIAKTESASDIEYLITIDGTGRYYVKFYDASSGNGIGKATVATCTTNTWIHFAITYDGSGATSGIKLYINGSEDTNTTDVSSGTYTAMHNGVGPVELGRLKYATTSGPFYGKMDEVAIFNTELSAANISAIYNSGTPASLASYNPVGWWRMGDDDGGTGTTITDQGSGGNNGTLTNGPTFSTDVP